MMLTHRACPAWKRRAPLVMVLLVLAAAFWAPAQARQDRELELALDHVFALSEPGAGGSFDAALAAPIVELVLTREPDGPDAFKPQPRNGCQGAYDAFTVRMGLPRMLQYLYNPKIPAHVMKPASLRSTTWLAAGQQGARLPRLWEALDGLGAPRVVQGLQQDTITPDQHSGAYYSYDLGRALILYRQGTRTVLLSVSRQVEASNVGRKGAVVGPDEQWNYLYSREKGLTIRGLGWVDSRIYEYSSILAYVWEEGRQSVRMGILQWLRAGWAGINVVKSKHIQNGLKRFQRDTRDILESPHLPEPRDLARAFERLGSLSRDELRGMYRPVVTGLLELVEQAPGDYPKVLVQELRGGGYLEGMTREELVNALMVEVMKAALGKKTAGGRTEIASLLR